MGTGFTPANFTLIDGQSYVVQADSYFNCFFSQWEDTSNASASRSIAITRDTAITALYNCPNTGNSVTVDSVDQNGNQIFGYYVVLNPGTSFQVTAFTTQTFALPYMPTYPPVNYTVQADGYGSCTFARWSDGVTSNPRQFPFLGGVQAFTAVYDCKAATTSTIDVSTFGL